VEGTVAPVGPRKPRNAGALVTSVERHGGQREKGGPVVGQALGDRAIRAAEHHLLARDAALGQQRVQLVDVARMRDRHHERAPGIADHPLDLALVVPLRRAAETILEEVMGLQAAEQRAPLARAVPEDLRHRQGGVVMEDRERHADEE
jgi:hypothetical protein